MDLAERRKNISVAVILLVVTLERLSYYALATNFFLFLNKGWNDSGAWDSVEAMTAVFVLAGTSYAFCLLGGYISDSYLGRFKTINIGFLFYIIGFVLLVLIAANALPLMLCQKSHMNGHLFETEIKKCTPSHATVYITVVIIGFGVGLVRSNIAPFAAEQLCTMESKTMRMFFNWFYWCINFGSLVGVGILSYVIQNNPGICTNGFVCGFSIAAGCLLFAVIIFVLMAPFYCISVPCGSLLKNVFGIFWEAACAKFKQWKSRSESDLNPPLHPAINRPSFLDRAKINFGGSYHEGAIEDVRTILSLLKIFLVLMPFWLVYFQMETSFQSQGLHMRLHVFPVNNFSNFSENLHSDFQATPTSFQIPAAWLTLFDELFLVFAIPLMAYFVYPRLDKAGVRISLLFRIGLGMFFSFAAVTTAGGLESERIYMWKNDNSTHINQVVGNVTYNAVNISIMWQVPQYILVGAAEALTSIAGLEFAYSSAPRSFQAIIMGLFYTLEGCGSFLGTVLLQACAPFFFSNRVDYTDINENHLDYYLYFLAILQFMTFLTFCFSCGICYFSAHLVGMSHWLSTQRSTRRLYLPSEAYAPTSYSPHLSPEQQSLLSQDEVIVQDSSEDGQSLEVEFKEEYHLSKKDVLVHKSDIEDTQ